MNAQSLYALSPLDGRYRERLFPLHQFFSEFSLIKYRVRVEIEYLLFLLEHARLQSVSSSEKKALRAVYQSFTEEQALAVKAHEQVCRHDVKAVEYFLQDICKEQHLERFIPYIHFGLTSEDTNSCAYGLAITEAVSEVMLPLISELLQVIVAIAEKNAETVMLARTHGQPAVPTTLGKEIIVFATRLEKTFQSLQSVKIEAKLSGAVGNWNAAQFALPAQDWQRFSSDFLNHLGLQANSVSTQIVPAETYSECFQVLVRMNVIILDCTRDFWQYISDNYLLQTTTAAHVGSSTMPQKVNPIEFENSEGNAGVAIALLQHFIEKLPVSRLQRDLSDSTVKRSIGTAFAHTFLALTSLKKGLQTVSPNAELMEHHVSDHPEVLAEALQTALRLSGNSEAYEHIKEKTRGKTITKQDLDDVAASITDEKLRNQFMSLQANRYVGLASTIVHQEATRIKKTTNLKGLNAKK